MELVALVDILCLQLDKDNSPPLLKLDLSAAFDTVDHSILLKHSETRGGVKVITLY